jgi:uncharacterized protein YeaO (DUF488 family)
MAGQDRAGQKGSWRMSLKLKRVYEEPHPSDGLRILVDRLWPRGLTRAKAQVDHWLKDVAPSHELRRWFGHEPERWAEFKRRYRAELSSKKQSIPVGELRSLARAGSVSILFGARDENRNQAVALVEILQLGRSGAGKRSRKSVTRKSRAASPASIIAATGKLSSSTHAKKTRAGKKRR